MKKLTKKQMAQARKQIGEEIGHLGGKARAERLSAARRSEIARQGAAARWGKGKDA